MFISFRTSPMHPSILVHTDGSVFCYLIDGIIVPSLGIHTFGIHSIGTLIRLDQRYIIYSIALVVTPERPASLAAGSTMDDAVRTGPSTARWGRRSTLLLMWSLGELVSILVYAFAGRLWGFVVAGVLLFALVFIFACYYLRTRGSTVGQQPDEPRPGHQHQVNGVGLSQGDIEAIPAFEYRAADADAAGAGGGEGSGPSSSSSVDVEECAVCISVLRSGETVRRLPACGHAFHARCINGWLRGHATCPICRAGIKVAGDGDPSPAAPAV